MVAEDRTCPTATAPESVRPDAHEGAAGTEQSFPVVELRMRRWPLVLLALATVVGCGGGLSTVSAADGVPSGAGQGGGAWQRLPDSPLAARQGAVGVWTGREVLVIGGNTALCPPGARCDMPEASLLRDGAAFDPAGPSWRAIAPAPLPVMSAASAVIGDDAYLWLTRGDGALLRYAVDEDRWDVLDVPVGVETGHLMVGVGERLLFYGGSDEVTEARDVLFDPRTGIAEEIPLDPLSPSFDRAMAFVDGALVLFAHDLVPNPGSEQPSLVRVARYRLAERTWETLSTSASLDTGPMFVDGARIVVPNLGSADGGDVNNWGRAHPYGAVFDVHANSWSDLPEAVSTSSGGVIGLGHGLYLSTAGPVLDTTSGRWIDVPSFSGDGGITTEQLVIAAGRRAFVFGGARWDGSAGELLDEAWLWEPPATVDRNATTTTATPTSTPPPTAASTEPGTCGEAGTESDLSDEPTYTPDSVGRWTNAAGCPVSLQVLLTRQPGPTFHCEGWPPDLVMGTPLGAATDETVPRVYVRDPDGYFGDPALRQGFAADLEPPPAAVDTGYDQGGVALWMDPADDRFAYLVSADGTERWPKATQVFGCA